MREHLALAQKLLNKYQKERWFLDAVEIYLEAVAGLVEDLSREELGSRGFLAFCEYLADYAGSPNFTALRGRTKQLQEGLASVKYCIHIKDSSTIRVRKYESEIDYTVGLERTFEKFRQGAVKDYRIKFQDWPEMNEVEAKILELVAQLYPELFSGLDNFCTQNTGFLDETIRAFDREIQFYLAYGEFFRRLERRGLEFCYPEVTGKSKEIYAREAFDLALASQLITTGSPIVRNDFYLTDPERIFIVSGPNQGGKTTFARTFGQLHYLASLGLPVPGREARLFLFDRLFTHFEKEEDISIYTGKLGDDLARIHAILREATPNSIIVLNEIFTSTTLQDAIFLSKKVLGKIIELDLLCVCVTFIDELASLSEKMVSLVSTVVPENPAQRTFKIVRRHSDGCSYAITIAEKYRLTYECLKERLNP